MKDAVERARAAGVRTALLSTSIGLDYPREDWPHLEAMLDVPLR